jgi:CheY-like chemotaxis protein
MNKHILIVDDDELVLCVLKTSLRLLLPDHQVIGFNDSTMALTELRQQAVDLILTDYDMPQLNGLELAQAAHKISPQTPIILMTGFSYDDIKTRVGADQLTGFIEKPFTTKQLREMLQLNQMLGC